jgi:large repetitive protein
MLHVVVQASPKGTATLTNLLVTARLPSGIGLGIPSGTVTVNGVTATTAADGDDVTLVGRDLQVRPGTLPANIVFDVRMGTHVDPAVDKPPVSVQASVSAVDIDRTILQSNASAALIFTQEIADLVSRIRSLDAPGPGAWVRYAATVSNSGPSAATNTVLSINIPPLISQVEISLALGCTAGVGVVTCPLPTIAAGAEVVREFRLLVDPAAAFGATYTLSVSASSDTFDPQLTSNTASIDELLGSVADISVAYAPNLVASAGGDADVIVTVANAGPNSARAVVLVARIPASLRRKAQKAGPTDCVLTDGGLVADSTFRCPVGDLAAGATATYTFFGSVAVDAPAGPLPLAASVTTTSTDPVLVNNTAPAAALTVGQTANLSIAEAVPEVVNAGGAWSSKIVVQNSGPSLAQKVVVKAIYDRSVGSLSAVSSPIKGTCAAVDNELVCTFTSLAVGGRIEIAVEGLVSSQASSTGEGLISQAAVGSSAVDPVPEDNVSRHTTPVRVSADLVASLTGPGSVVAGQPATYRLTVRNNGPSEAVGVVMPVDVSELLIDLSVTSDLSGHGCFVSDLGGINCGRIRLGAGSSVTVTITGRTSGDLPAGAVVSLAARPRSDTPDANLENNVASVRSEVTLFPALQLSIAEATQTVVAGGLATYTVTVTNSGLTRADNVTLDVKVSSVDATPVIVSCSRCEIGRLEAAGGSRQISITVRVPSSAPNGAGFTVTAVANSEGSHPPPVEMFTRVSVENQLVIASSAPPTVVAGRTFAISYGVSNPGPSDATSVRLTVSSPALAPFDSADGCSVTGDVVICEVGTLAANATRTFTIVFKTDPGLVDSVSIGYSATSQPLEKSARGSTVVGVSTEADVSVSSKFTPTIVAGANGSGEFLIRNLGPSTARRVSFVVTVGELVTRPSLLNDPSVSCRSVVGRVFVCTTGDIAPNRTISLKLGAPVGRDAVDGSSAGYSLVLATPTNDPDPSNDRTDGVLQILARSDVGVTVESLAVVKAGGQLPIDFLLSNKGFSTAENVTLRIDLPSDALTSGAVAANGSDCTPLSLGSLACRVGTLPPGGRTLVSILGVVRGGTPENATLAMSASVASDTEDVDGNNNALAFSGRVQGRTVDPADEKLLEEFGKVGNSVVLAGQVENRSTESIPNVFVVQDVPSGQRVVAAAITRGRCDTTGRQVMCAVGAIEASERIDVRVTTIVERATTEMANLTMSAYSASDEVAEFRVQDDLFVRPRVSGVSDLTVINTRKPIPLTTSAKGPLLAAVLLVLVFALGMVGWIRKGRSEDPLALIGPNGFDLYEGLTATPDRYAQYDRLDHLDRMNGIGRSDQLETVGR